MERSTSDEFADVSVAIADPPPSMSAAHWANRDNDTLNRRPGRTGTFRRPPAENSFPEQPAPAEPAYPPPASYPPPSSSYPPPSSVEPEFAQPEDTGVLQVPPDQAASGYRTPDYSAPDHSVPEHAVPDYVAYGFDESSFSPAEPLGADDRTTEQQLRHWTTIGDEARRPRTSDRDEVSAPFTAADDPAAPTFGPGSSRSWVSRRAAGGPPAPEPGNARPNGKPARPAKPPRAPKNGSAANNDLIDAVGLLGPGRDIRPHRAGGPDQFKTSRGTAIDTQPARRRSRLALWATVSLSVLILLGGGVTAVAFFSGTPDGLASVLRSDAGRTGGKSVTAPLQDRTEASFEIVTGTTQVTLRSEDLGADLYRITSAEDSGTVPFPVVDGDRVQLHLTPDGDGASGNVEVVLSAKVRWALRFTGGADQQRIDMSQGRVGAVDLIGGARRVELTLPPASGTVPVRVAGAVDELVVTTPQDSPVRVQLDSGAKTVAAGDRTLRDVKPGSTFTPKDWKTANRYDVDVAARVTLLSVGTAVAQ